VLSLFSSAIVDAALAITALEVIVLLVHRRRTGRGIAAPAVLANVGAGLFLMLAVRVALTDAAWPWLAACLVAAGAAHAVDLSMRWRRH
jgi:hypothetical protein